MTAPVPNERQQFRILYRGFLSRAVDPELMAAGGDAQGLIARVGSMLAALSFVLAYLIVLPYATSGSFDGGLTLKTWNDEEFLISTTITVAGLFAVMAWNTVFPDRRDSLILGLIPVRTRTMILARIDAIATVLSAVVVAVNIFTGLSFPFVMATGALDGIRSFAAWWLTLAAASVFTFCSGLLLQGIAAQLLPWMWFLRISGMLQLAALFVVLGLFFLTPAFDPANLPVFIPSFWFVGLLHVLRGDANTVFPTLATRAITGLAVVITMAAILYVLAWGRNIRRMVEAPEILPARHSRFTNRLVKFCSPAPFERSILLFTARTIARSRQHRLMLAIYGGFAFALSLAFSGGLLRSMREAWSKPNEAFLLAGFLLLAGAVAGTRAIFALPTALQANWIFRIAAVHRPGAYFAAVRRSLYTIAALPVWIATAICYLAIWPGRPAFEHILVLALIGIVLVERSLYQFRKIPFTCSWLPGSTHGKMKAAVWGCVFIVLGFFAAQIELWTMEKLARMLILLSLLGAAAFRARRATTEFAAEPDNRIQFEDLPPGEIFALDLRQDGGWSGDEAYVEAIDPSKGRGLGRRIRPFAIGAVLLLMAGFVHEQVEEWRDRRQFPQIGRSVDIGGRSLNLYCSGTGSPAVVFDAGGNQPGYSWILVQPEVAKRTRSCWYDRAGYGWSDPAPGPRSSADIADDLHKLLRAAGVPPPYVVVGHSFGGFNVRVYAGRYRNEVAGMVLVDSSDAAKGPLPESVQAPARRYVPDWLWGPAEVVSQWLVHLGVGRLIDEGAGGSNGAMSARDLAIIHSLQLEAKAFDMAMREGRDRDESAAQVRAIRSLGDLPLIVLTGAGNLKPPDGESDGDSNDLRTQIGFMRNRVYGTQKRLAALSTRGQQIILPVGHAIPTEAPRAVIDAVGEILREIGGLRHQNTP